MCDGINAALYISATYCGIVNGNTTRKLPIEVVTDNKSLHNALKSPKYVSDKRLRIDIHHHHHHIRFNVHFPC